MTLITNQTGLSDRLIEMSDLQELQRLVIKFRDARNWKQFHNPKDLTISLLLEAAELLEHFQWKSKEEMDQRLRTHRDEVSEELADVFYWVLLIAHDLGIDLTKEFKRKMGHNEKKYPIEKSKNKHTKYTEL